ncbi:BgTH12-06797 [Blumeria graminis f. sp. triticale]|uniref:BgTH12-06797 n=1 Tax=Blumeria graminis f. sp. triticale TaxID=1689686 RepID=A0A9W4GJF5_BLUGR|nr:BgTH12-06797 [Blumeria graminis f. sp. triticale]
MYYLSLHYLEYRKLYVFEELKL